MLRKLMYVFMIIFFAIASVAAFFAASGLYTAKKTTEPITDFVQQLLIPATPVILPNPMTLLRNITDEARLMTVSADYEKVIVAERNQEVLFGALGESLVFVANGKVTAGIDLNKMTENDIQVVDPTTVMI